MAPQRQPEKGVFLCEIDAVAGGVVAGVAVVVVVVRVVVRGAILHPHLPRMMRIHPLLSIVCVGAPIE